MTIKVKDSLGLGIVISLFILGGLNIGKIVILKVNYIFCLSVAVFIVMLAAVVFEIAEKSHRIFWLKLLYFAMWILIGSAVLLPLVIAWQNFLRPYDMELMSINLGLVLLLFFIKEVVRDWKNRPQKRAKSQYSTGHDSYFEELPRVMRRKKRIDVYFD
jgi:uncharacterized membrane protein YcjF (UPF0283 family)